MTVIYLFIGIITLLLATFKLYLSVTEERDAQYKMLKGKLEHLADRKSVVQGKSVDLGGRRIIKKKKRER